MINRSPNSGLWTRTWGLLVGGLVFLTCIMAASIVRAQKELPLFFFPFFFYFAYDLFFSSFFFFISRMNLFFLLFSFYFVYELLFLPFSFYFTYELFFLPFSSRLSPFKHRKRDECEGLLPLQQSAQKPIAP